jgi:ribulose-5-phosphate 4-epimerase/fuculose-1-phosphate aldolase
MTIEAARQSMVEAGRWLSDRGLTPGSSGNLSVRVGDEWLMTPGGSPLGRLRADRLARLDAERSHVEGDTQTKEWPLHFSVYEARTDAAAIVHLHSTYAVALACLPDLDPNEPLAPLTPYQIMRVDRIGLVAYARPGSAELAAAVRELAPHHAVLLLANHGPVVAASTLDAAVYAADELEEAAKLRFVLHGRPTRLLDRAQVDDIRRHR